MPQTRFVLRKALALEKKVIVVVNKIDRPAARCAPCAHACSAQEAGRLCHGSAMRMLPVSPPWEPPFRPMISRLSDVSLTLLWSPTQHLHRHLHRSFHAKKGIFAGRTL